LLRRIANRVRRVLPPSSISSVVTTQTVPGKCPKISVNRSLLILTGRFINLLVLYTGTRLCVDRNCEHISAMR
jgi:hypothetical protein